MCRRHIRTVQIHTTTRMCAIWGVNTEQHNIRFNASVANAHWIANGIRNLAIQNIDKGEKERTKRNWRRRKSRARDCREGDRTTNPCIYCSIVWTSISIPNIIVPLTLSFFLFFSFSLSLTRSLSSSLVLSRPLSLSIVLSLRRSFLRSFRKFPTLFKQ